MSLEGDLIFVFPSTERGAKVGGLWIGSSLWHSSEVLFSRGRFHYCWVFSRFKITLLHICLWVLNSFVGAYNHYITATVQAEMWLMFYVMAKSSINSYSDEVLLILKKCFFHFTIIPHLNTLALSCYLVKAWQVSQRFIDCLTLK